MQRHLTYKSILRVVSSAFAVVLGISSLAGAYPVRWEDASGREIVVTHKPRRVVSLVPAVTEMIFALGAGERLEGVTAYDLHPAAANKKTVVGGFFQPSPKRVAQCDPDLVFLSSLHDAAREHFRSSMSPDKVLLVETTPRSIEDIYEHIRFLGEVFDRTAKAEALVAELRAQFRRIAQKTAKIPQDKRKRVIRLMGRDRVMTPGDDSFQNELIRAAGGIPPKLGKEGSVVPVTLNEWLRFDPQVIYGCGGDRQTAEELLTLPGWKDVEAVKEGRIYFFPCALTCRASVHAGYFVAWLAGRVYPEELSKPANWISPQGPTGSRRLWIDLDYIQEALIRSSLVYDFPSKSLEVHFKSPMKVLSTMEGPRGGIVTVGNHFSPPPCWDMMHRLGLERLRTRVYSALGHSREDTSFLFTGADMDNLSVQKNSYKDLTVYALVTAGVESNAVRMGAEEGTYYEPGTINVIVLANHRLSSRAMARTVISATEAKTAVLQDMDIRSAARPRFLQATGTGTDNIIVVEGRGASLDNAEGHSKLGELIARSVYQGVQEAVRKQNAIVPRRSLLRRLHERRIRPYGLLSRCEGLENPRRLVGRLEDLLLDPFVSAFMESALALSDARERGRVRNLDPFKAWCRQMAEHIAGQKPPSHKKLITDTELPIVLRMAFDALINGLIHQDPETGKEVFHDSVPQARDLSSDEDMGPAFGAPACLDQPSLGAGG